jgi:tetratricopeptide (TPR) repeat protein
LLVVVPPASSPSIPPEAVGTGGDLPEELPQVLAEDQRVPLRLTASRGVLGLELYEAVELGPIRVSRLSVTLPGLKFPVDLSGGVPKFRHRRGQLERVRLEIARTELERWVGRHVGDALGTLVRPPSVWPITGGFGFGFVTQSGALAFDVLWAPSHGDARFVIDGARAVGFELPALGLALRIADAVLGKIGTRRGRALTVTGVGQRIGRALLPAVGARAPSAGEVRFGALVQGEQSLGVELDALADPPEIGFRAARALELSLLVEAADDALAAGSIDVARTAYVTALERAPRHPELSRAVAEIDARIGGRAQAALGLLVESLPATQAGLIGAELLACAGDVHGARDAVEAAARHERFAPLSAWYFRRLAELEVEAPARVHALDRAVAHAPGLAEVRWARFEERARRGDVEGAVADAEHLEAIESGARSRHDVCRRAARRLLDVGLDVAAGRLFERALRYVPDDATATAGLARALVLAGRPERALPLLERALELAARAGQIDAEASIDLGKILADHVQDLPQAIARVRSVPASSDRLVEARYLEARWRARVGDRIGATLSFGRLREAVELTLAPDPAWATWLAEAGENSLTVDRDPAAAERHFGLALRLAPRDERLGERYREAAQKLAERRRG